MQRADHHERRFVVDAADHRRPLFQRQEFVDRLADDVHDDVYLVLLCGKYMSVAYIHVTADDIIVIQWDGVADKRVAIAEKPLLLRFQHIVMDEVEGDPAVPHGDKFIYKFAFARLVVRRDQRAADSRKFSVKEQQGDASDIVFAQHIDVGIHGARIDDQPFGLRIEQLFQDLALRLVAVEGVVKSDDASVCERVFLRSLVHVRVHVAVIGQYHRDYPRLFVRCHILAYKGAAAPLPLDDPVAFKPFDGMDHRIAADAVFLHQFVFGRDLCARYIGLIRYFS